jgi:Competence protein CoiA-like family
MPLRCLTQNDQSIHAFELTESQWIDLKAQNRKLAELRMPCCNTPVVFKTSKLGNRFFAHKPKAVCNYKPETEHHIRIKQAILMAAREAGWTANAETSGASATNERWIADVLATSPKGSKVAFEVQWSKQSDADTQSRQDRYAQSGVRCLWLFRQKSFPADQDTPAVHIEFVDGQYLVNIAVGHAGPGGFSFSHMPLNRFLTSVFKGFFRFGAEIGALTRLDIITAPYECWKNGCCDVRIVSRLEIWNGPHQHTYFVSDLDDHPELARFVQEQIRGRERVGQIKKRYSKTMGHAYLSNGCAQCDVIVGQFYEHQFWNGDEEAISVCFPLNREWKRLIESEDGYLGSWAVHWPTSSHPVTSP